MGRRGNCWGNAPTEKLWDRLRAASVHGHKFANREQATQPVMDWMDPYNNCRLHSALGCLSLVRFDKHGCEAQRKKAAQSSGYELHETRERSLFHPQRILEKSCEQALDDGFLPLARAPWARMTLGLGAGTEKTDQGRNPEGRWVLAPGWVGYIWAQVIPMHAAVV